MTSSKKDTGTRKVPPAAATIAVIDELLELSFPILSKVYESSKGAVSFAQIRLAMVAYVITRDASILAGSGSLFGVELSIRPLVETFINAKWIRLGPGSKNYKLYVIDDNLKMARSASSLANHFRAVENLEEAKSWDRIESLNIRQAKQAYRSTKYLSGREQCPNLYQRARQVDEALGTDDREFEYIVAYFYNLAHHAVHVSNRQLNRIAEPEGVWLDGSAEDRAIVINYVAVLYLALLIEVFADQKQRIELEHYWEVL